MRLRPGSRNGTIAAGLICAALGFGCDGGLDPNQFADCDSLRSQEAVQAALAALSAGGSGFTFLTGASPADISGSYDITSAVATFTAAGPGAQSLPLGRMSFTSQTLGGRIDWSLAQDDGTTAAGLRGFISGTAAGVTTCLFAQVDLGDASTSCATQNAIFFTLASSDGGQTLTGTFLNVVLLVLTGDCAAAGDFSFGTIALKRVDETLPVIESIRTISTGTSAPRSVVLNSNGSVGFVATDNGSVIRFETATGQTRTLLPPQPNSITGAGPLGISSDGSVVGFVSLGDNRLLTYDVASSQLRGQTIPPTTPSQGAFPALAPLYNATGTAGYAGTTYVNHRPSVAAFNPVAGSTASQISGAAFFTQTDLVRLRMSPGGTLAAGLLRGAAAAGRARFVAFVSLAGGTLNAEIDLSSAIFNEVNDDVLEFSTDGMRVFLTTGGLIVSVGSTGSHAIDTVDVRENAADAARLLAVSDDNGALAVLLAAGGGRANLVLLNPATLAEIERLTLSTAAIGATGGHAEFFTGTRFLLIEDGAGNVTPTGTQEPFKTGNTLRAASAAGTATITDMAVAGRVAAVANATDRAVYLIGLSSP